MQDYATLRAFVAVAKTGSVSRAAEQLHLTQPAISLKLKQLQANLGLNLFSRRPQGLALTADGHALLPAAEKALASAHAFEQTAGALHNTLRGKLTIGTIVDPEFLPPRRLFKSPDGTRPAVRNRTAPRDERQCAESY